MKTTFQGPVRSLGGFYTQGPNTVVEVADGTNTLSLTVADHAGRIIRTNDASLTLTLPSIVATAASASSGPGADPNTTNNLGASFYIFVETAATSIKITTDGTDKFVGSVLMVDTDTAGATTGYAPGASDDAINLNGTTQGGIAGSWVRVTAVDAAKWMVEGVLLGSSTVQTPFATS